MVAEQRSRKLSIARCLSIARRKTRDWNSPSASGVTSGEALDYLDALKQEELARCVGVSCDDRATLASIASDKRVEAIEAPFGPNH